MRIAHLSLDEKFIDCAIEQFSDLHDVESEFCVCAEGDKAKLVKSPDIKIFHTSEQIVCYVNENHFDYAVLHSLCLSPRILSKLQMPILWCSWGYDIYSDKKATKRKPIVLDLFKPLTRKALGPQQTTFKEKLKYLLLKIGYKSSLQKHHDAFLKKISYLSVVLPEEFEMVKKNFKQLRFFPFRYVDKDNGALNHNILSPTKSILLGNSLDPTNNHIDILQSLENIKVHCKVYIPISYPNVPGPYKKRLKEFAEHLQYVTPIFLEEFIPREQYFDIINECSIAIFGHIRQQAVGNILHMFCEGRKIFLYKDSIAYKHFYNAGAKIFSIENDLEPTIFDSVLGEDIQNKNRSIVRNEDYYATYIKQLQAFFDNLANSENEGS
jgi:hypothetical protein